MSKKQKVAIIIIALLVIGFFIGFCIFYTLGSVDWAKVVSDFLGRVWGNEY